MNIGMCACGGIYCKYCGDPYRAPVSTGVTTSSTNIQLPLTDHGISPAQLREKVEALQERANRDADKHNRLCDIVGDHMRRLDAALKRIEELERARPTRPENVWKNDPALTVTHVDAENGVVTLERKP